MQAPQSTHWTTEADTLLGVVPLRMVRLLIGVTVCEMVYAPFDSVSFRVETNTVESYRMVRPNHTVHGAQSTGTDK